MKKRYLFVGMVAVSLSLLVAGQAFSAATKYTVPVISDFTGAYAELFKSWVPAQKAVFAWWSDTEGKKLGTKSHPQAL